MDLNEALKTIKRLGYKMTNKRKQILLFFDNADGYRTAKELCSYLKLEFKNISFDTIYRNLHLFHDIGLLESTELNGERHFRLKCSRQHHHHFICQDCGKTEAINICPMDEVQQELKHFKIESHKFEIYGKCPTCQI